MAKTLALRIVCPAHIAATCCRLDLSDHPRSILLESRDQGSVLELSDNLVLCEIVRQPGYVRSLKQAVGRTLTVRISFVNFSSCRDKHPEGFNWHIAPSGEIWCFTGVDKLHILHICSCRCDPVQPAPWHSNQAVCCCAVSQVTVIELRPVAWAHECRSCYC